MLKYHMSLVELCRIARMHPLYCQWKVRHSHQRVQNPLYQAVHIFFSLPEAVDDMRAQEYRSEHFWSIFFHPCLPQFV